MKNWTCKILPNLPKPPDNLIANIDSDYRPRQDNFSPNDDQYLGIKKSDDWKKQEYDWIQPMASNKNMRQRFKPNFTKWVKENIVTDFHESNSGVMFFDEPQLPHTDLTRDYVLLYNVLPGGKNPTLCFWQEVGQDTIRERMITVPRGEKLKLIDQVAGPFNCWYLVNTRILHSVENLEGLRLNLQISFDKSFPDQLFKNI